MLRDLSSAGVQAGVDGLLLPRPDSPVGGSRFEYVGCLFHPCSWVNGHHFRLMLIIPRSVSPKRCPSLTRAQGSVGQGERGGLGKGRAQRIRNDPYGNKEEEKPLVKWAWGSWAPQGAMALAVACDTSYPLEGSRHGAVEDVGGPWGSSRPLNPGGPIPPSPWALPGMGDSRGRQRAE